MSSSVSGTNSSQTRIAVGGESQTLQQIWEEPIQDHMSAELRWLACPYPYDALGGGSERRDVIRNPETLFQMLSRGTFRCVVPIEKPRRRHPKIWDGDERP